MSKTLRWVLILLPCAPGVTILLAALAAFFLDRQDLWRVEQIGLAGGAVLLAGLVIGAFVAWRIAHPRPLEEDEDEEQTPPR